LTRATVDDRKPEAVGRLAGLLLDCDLAQHGQADTAVLARHVEHREAGLARLPPHAVDILRVDRALLDDPLLQRVDLLLDEPCDALLQFADLYREFGNDHVTS